MDEFFKELFSEILAAHAACLWKEKDVYYGNVCKKCFKSGASKMCGSCKVVHYCSVEHQTEDWINHRNICRILKTGSDIFACQKNCTFKDFTEYRRKLGVYLKENLGENNISPFKEYFKFPWVCALCYSKDNLRFECEKCKVVVYCSSEHRHQGQKDHQPNCNGLKMAKTFDSVSFYNGYQCRKLLFFLNQLPSIIRDFPPDMISLSLISQNQIKGTPNMQELIPFTLFNDSLSGVASILYAFKKIGLFRSRIYLGKPSLSLNDRKKNLKKRTASILTGNFNTLTQIKMKNSLIIHFVAADDYEVHEFWGYVLILLFQWLCNVDYIEIILVGRSLLNYKQPNVFPWHASNLQYYPFPYETIVKNLVKPDLVVFYNYDKKDVKEFEDQNSQKSLFFHDDVPLVLTGTKKSNLNHFVNELTKIEGVSVKLSVHKNPFAGRRPHREWDEKEMSVFYENEYVAVLTKV